MPGKRFIKGFLFIFTCAITQAAPVYFNNDQPVHSQLRQMAQESPNWAIEVHKINNIWLAITNGGSFGIGFAGAFIDPETGQPAPSC
jgi:hypothetical protein